MRNVWSLLLVTALLAGCGQGSAGPKLKEAQLRTLVLQPKDLPRGLEEFDFGRQLTTDAHPGPRRDQTRFGRQDGWKARYRRGGKDATVIESRVDVFAHVGGAKQDLDAYSAEFENSKAAGWKPLTVAAIGDGSRGATLLQRAPGGGLRYFTIAWRDGRLTASVTIAGFARSMRLDEALALARKQERRLARIK